MRCVSEIKSQQEREILARSAHSLRQFYGGFHHRHKSSELVARRRISGPPLRQGYLQEHVMVASTVLFLACCNAGRAAEWSAEWGSVNGAASRSTLGAPVRTKDVGALPVLLRRTAKRAAAPSVSVEPANTAYRPLGNDGGKGSLDFR
jgi:hypothetical protein